ncbi:MAG: DUF2240 family protein [Thermoplasmatales archaeon]|nr:MAG: DUF2240 family protein [Thermoplasmatales archaeon]
MPSEEKIIIGFLFRRVGKKKLSLSDLYLSLSLDLDWFSPKEAKKFVNRALKKNLLIKEEGKVTPSFVYENISIPVDFFPSESFEEKEENLLDIDTKKESQNIIKKIVDKIAEKTGKNERELIEKITSVSNEKEISREVSAIYLGVFYGVNLSEFFDFVEKGIFK